MLLSRPAITTLTAALWLCGSCLAVAQESLDTEAEELQSALESLDQSYEFLGLRSGHGSARVGGSQYADPVPPRKRPPARSAAPREDLPVLKTPPSP